MMTNEEKELIKAQKEKEKAEKALQKQLLKEQKEKEKAEKARLVEFKKFLSDFCSHQYDFLSMDQLAFFTPEDNAEIIYICFPKQKYTYVFGIIDLSDCPSFNEWVKRKHGTIKLDSEFLKDLKGRKIGDFQELTVTDYEYTVKTIDKEYKLVKEKIDVDIPVINEEIDYSYGIKPELLESGKFKLYYNSDGRPTSVVTSKILIEAPTRMFKFIQKSGEENPDVKYSIKVSKPTDDKSRIVLFASKGKKITIFQQFRVI